MKAYLLLFVGIFFGACASTHPYPSTELLPASPYFAVLDTQAAIDPQSQAWFAPFAKHLDDLTEYALLSQEERAAMGLAEGHYILFALGLRPALALPVADPSRLQSVLGGEVIADNLYSRERGLSTLSYTFREDLILLTFHQPELPPAEIFGQPEDAPSLADSQLILDALAQHPKEAALFAFVDLRALDQALPKSATTPECLDASKAFIKAVPSLSLSLSLDSGLKLKALAALSLETAALFKALGNTHSKLAPDLGEDAIFQARLGLSPNALRRFDSYHEDLLECPHLGALYGAARVFTGRLAKTDAPQVFGDEIFLAIYDFDLAIPLLSKRRALLLFATPEPQRFRNGLDLILRGLDFIADSDGSITSYATLLRTFSFELRAYERHVALSIGELDPGLQDKLQSRASPVPTFWAALNGERLRQMTAAWREEARQSDSVLLQGIGYFIDNLKELRVVSGVKSNLSIELNLEWKDASPQ